MILTNDQLLLGKIVEEDGLYDCRLVMQQFSYRLLGEEVSPLGNIICFESPTAVGPLVMSNALVLAGELPNTSMFGAVCFQRLYATQLGSLFSLITGKEAYVDDSCIFTDGLQASVTLLNKVKDSVIFNIIFPIEMQTEGMDTFNMLALEEQHLADFKHNAIESFKHLTKSIFVETRRDNF